MRYFDNFGENDSGGQKSMSHFRIHIDTTSNTFRVTFKNASQQRRTFSQICFVFIVVWYRTISKISESSTLSPGQTPPKQNPILNTLNGLYYTLHHYSDVIMGAMESQITGLSIVCSVVCSGADQRKHQSSASLCFVRGIHRWPVDSPHKWPVTRKMFPFDDVIIDLPVEWSSTAVSGKEPLCSINTVLGGMIRGGSVDRDTKAKTRTMSHWMLPFLYKWNHMVLVYFW